MRKGIIMEIDERFLTLLTPEGEFLKARKQAQSYSIGEEIHFFPITEAEKKRIFFSKFSLGKALPAAALALMVAGAIFIPLNTNDEVYAYMSIDVNPSIELAVNDELEVVDVEAYNSEGEQILANIEDWNHTEVAVVTTNIIKEIKKQGFLKETNQVVISTVLEDKEKKVAEKLEANLHQIEEKIEKENVEMTVVQGTKQERKAAVKQGMTTGIYKEKTKKAEIKLEEEVKKKELTPEKKQDQPTNPSEDNGNKVTNGKGKTQNDKQENDNGKQQTPGQQKKIEIENSKDGKGKSDKKENESKKKLPNKADKNNKGKDNGNNQKVKKQENNKENNQNKSNKKDEKDKLNKSQKDNND